MHSKDQSIGEIAVLGVPAVDQVAHIPHFPEPEGHVSGSKLILVPGGPACNVVTAVQRLGGRAKLMGSVGNDVWGNIIRSSLQHEGVDLTYLGIGPPESTIIVLVLLDGDGRGLQRSFSFNLAEQLDTEIFAEVEKTYSPGCHIGAVFLDGILAFSETWTQSAVRVASTLFSEVPYMVCDPNLRIPNRQLPEDMHRRVNALLAISDVILVNETEAFVLTDTDNPNAAADVFFDTFSKCKILVVKLGERGAVLFRRNERGQIDVPLHIPACRVDFVDSSGAGDSFAAGFVQALLEGHDLETCGKLACASGALATTTKGAWHGMPPRRVRDRLLQKEMPCNE